MTLGLFEKSVLADGFLGPVVDQILQREDHPGFVDAWVATLAFSGQIFCDFAGYSITAIGAALCMGFALSDNFRFPYAAVGFTDFCADGTSPFPRGCATTYTFPWVATAMETRGPTLR